MIASHGHRDISAQLAEIDAGHVPAGRVLYRFYVLAPFSDEKGCLTPGCNSRGAESMQAACAPNMVVLMCLMCGGRRTAAALSSEVVI